MEAHLASCLPAHDEPGVAQALHARHRQRLERRGKAMLPVDDEELLFRRLHVPDRSPIGPKGRTPGARA